MFLKSIPDEMKYLALRDYVETSLKVNFDLNTEQADRVIDAIIENYFKGDEGTLTA